MKRRRSRSRRRLPDHEVSAVIESLSHDGRGIAKPQGKTTFVHGALPGESIRFQYTACHHQYDEATTVHVEQSSPERVDAPCAHFDRCGGCSLQHLRADRQIHYKQEWLLDNLARIGHVDAESVATALTGPTEGYRYKARLGVKYVAGKGRVLVGFRERQNTYIADLERCVVLDPRVGSLLPALSEMISELSIYNRLPQIEVALSKHCVGLSFRVLDPPSETDAERLVDFAKQHDCVVYLQPKGPASTYALWPTDPKLSYRLDAFNVEFEFLPYHFTQVNPFINSQMVQRAIDWLQLSTTDVVVDLFCGLGNFSLPIARRCAKVIGLEGEQSLVDWAVRNSKAQNIDNCEFRVADLAAETATAHWGSDPVDKILLDPPRSGALAILPAIGRSNAKRIVYVSCHPATLARDLGLLVNDYGYRLRTCAVMDMFPHTAHVESIALLEKV